MDDKLLDNKYSTYRLIPDKVFIKPETLSTFEVLPESILCLVLFDLWSTINIYPFVRLIFDPGGSIPTWLD